MVHRLVGAARYVKMRRKISCSGHSAIYPSDLPPQYPVLAQAEDGIGAERSSVSAAPAGSGSSRRDEQEKSRKVAPARGPRDRFTSGLRRLRLPSVRYHETSRGYGVKVVACCTWKPWNNEREHVFFLRTISKTPMLCKGRSIEIAGYSKPGCATSNVFFAPKPWRDETGMQNAETIKPPGRKIRYASRIALGRSGPSIRAIVESTASKNAPGILQ